MFNSKELRESAKALELDNGISKDDEINDVSSSTSDREHATSSPLPQSHCDMETSIDVPDITSNREKASENLKEVHLKHDALRVERALGSISEYTKRIKNFIGIESEDSGENSDTESAIDNLSRSTSKTEDNVKVLEKINTRELEEDEHSFVDGKLSTESEKGNKELSYVENKGETHSAEMNENILNTNELGNSAQLTNIVDMLDVKANDHEKVGEAYLKNCSKEKARSTEDRKSDEEISKGITHHANLSEDKESDNISNDDFYVMNETEDRTISSESFLEDNKVPQTSQSNIPVEHMDPDTVCGFGCFKPRWMQQYATARSYLVFYSIIGVLQGSYFTYLIGCLTTLEKRYAFKSKVSGTIMMLDEITPLLLGVLIGYFGGRAHRPRIVTLGMFMTSLCCFVSALPYFMYGTSQQLVASYVANNTAMEYCDWEVKHEVCDEDDRPPTFVAVACLFIGSFFKGFGNLACYAVGMSYMDDNTKKKNTPIYFAICTALRMAGPILGFLMSSCFLKYYENPFGDPGYGPEDPRWIGAWWLGFVLQGVLLFIFSFPILLFPRRLPRQRLRAFSNTKNFEIETNTERMKGLITAVVRLLKNPVFICFTFGTVFSLISGYGYFTMLPKYLEIQFRLSASDANILSGPPCITAAQVMTIIGGILIYKVRPKSKALLSCLTITEANWIIGCFILMWPSCRNLLMSGTTMAEEGLQLQNNCNSECLCSTTAFNPVCGPDGISNYFSPCHAGCKAVNASNPEIIGNCSCILNSTGAFIVSDAIERGLCPAEGCWEKAVLYVCILTLLSGIGGSFRVAHTMILLRSVDPQDKSLALGLFETIVCGCAFIPLPLIFGALADAACLIWEKSCGETGNCWFYDVDRFNYLLHGISAAFTAFALVCYITVIFLSHRVKDLYDDEILEYELPETSKASATKPTNENLNPK